MNYYSTEVNGLRVAVVQMSIDQKPEINAKRFLREAEKAAEAGADIIVGPEMMLNHYLSSDRYEDESFVSNVFENVLGIANAWTREEVLVFGGIGLDVFEGTGEDGRLRKYNAGFVVQSGRFVTNRPGSPFTIKSLMPDYRIFDDNRHFYSLQKVAVERGETLKHLQRPFSVEIRGQIVNLGVMICEDMWDHDYHEKPARNLALNGADILINLSASPWSWQKNRKRDEVVRAICQEVSLPFVYVNNVGVQNNGKNFIPFDGASTVYDPEGNIIAMTDYYQKQTKIVCFDAQLPTLEREEQSDVALLYQAIKVAALGHLGTLPESTKEKVVIGASGGMDSALSVAFYADLLGPDRVIAVNMPYGDYNSQETKDDARELCLRLGVEYRVVQIDDIVDSTCLVSGISKGTSEHKTTQAIARMTVLAAIAGKEKGFFTCNANMTEIAFGYGTLNGDLRGAFAPWMNCLKQDVYRLGDYLNREVFKREVIPQSIIDRPPMDELVAEGTSDRGDPFDYGDVLNNGYHDQLVRAMVAFRRDAKWLEEQYRAKTLEKEFALPTGKIKQLFPNDAVFFADVERCFNLFYNSVFKRVQSVPGPLVDKRGFGYDLRESIMPW